MDYKKIECEVLAFAKLYTGTTRQTQNLQVKDEAGRKFWLQCFNNVNLLAGIEVGDKIKINYRSDAKLAKDGRVFNNNYLNALEKIRPLNIFEQFYANLNTPQKETVDKTFRLLTTRRNTLDKPHVAFYTSELEKLLGWIPLRDRINKMAKSEDYEFLTNENVFESIKNYNL